MSKKLIILTAAVGLICFAGAFLLAGFTKQKPVNQNIESNQPPGQMQKGRQTEQQPQPNAEDQTTGQLGHGVFRQSTLQSGMTEKQLKNLVFEVQDKKRQYENKLQGLQTQEKRIQMAQDMLKKDIENLNNLRVELASTVAQLKKQREKLLNSKIEIAQTEKANLAKIAATYDKMDAASASKILINMCAGQTQRRSVETSEDNINDAVKILHYMNERTKAKVLAESVTSEPTLTAALCERLKHIIEEK